MDYEGTDNSKDPILKIIKDASFEVKTLCKQVDLSECKYGVTIYIPSIHKDYIENDEYNKNYLKDVISQLPNFSKYIYYPSDKYIDHVYVIPNVEMSPIKINYNN